MNGPISSQIDRDRLADVVLSEDGDDADTGDGASREEMATAS